jgi:hypothetical protein
MSSVGAIGHGGQNPLANFQQNLFNQIGSGGIGSITKSELEQAVTSAGGTAQGADALYAKLNPSNTASVSEPQFAQFMQPSPAGNTAQDALLALIGDFTSNRNSWITGNPAQTGNGSSGFDPLLSLLDGSTDGGTSGLGTPGNTTQNALLALMQASSANPSNLNGDSSMSGTASSTDLMFATSRYQDQLTQQMFGSMFGAAGARI